MRTNHRAVPVIRTVTTPIAIDGLEAEVEVTSHADEDLIGFTHRITYRSKLRGARLSFKFVSALTATEHRYELASSSLDSLGACRQTWIHSGATRTDSTAPAEGVAYITTQEKSGGSEVRYIASADLPFSMPYEGTIPVPFT